MAAGLIHQFILSSALAGAGTAGTHGHAAALPAVGPYPAESRAPGVSARRVPRPQATHVDRGPHDWYVVVRPQHRRLGPSVVPAQPRILEPGLLLHSASERRGAWLRCYDAQGKSWVNVANVRPAQQPHGWDTLVLKIHPVLRQVRTVSHLPSPLPVANAAPATSAGAAAATPAPAQPAVPQQVVQVVQVVQPAPLVVQPAGSIPDQIVAAGDAAWGPGQGQALLWIAMRESGANPYAVNPASGSCGIAQRLPCTVPLGNAPVQIADMVQYVTARYGNASNARAFWAQNSWY